MKIAQIAPLIERVPPKKYGGTERVVNALTEELVSRGHEVTLFASGDSVTSAKLVSVYPRNLREARIKNMYGLNPLTLLNVGLAYSMQDEFDIIHDHTGHIGMPMANISRTPAVITLHGAIDLENRRLFEKMKRPYLVTISKAQAAYAPNLNYIGNVYNGLSLDGCPALEKREDFLLFVGRISMEKGVHFAVETAIALNRPLVIAAKLEAVDLSYFNEYIGPYLSDNIRWIGEVGEKERNDLMSRAFCFLHPVTWPEPFGLTLIESMACGCPVVAFNKGSIPEVIADKKTGFVVANLEEMIEAVGNIALIDREECRKYSLENFNEKKMAGGYELVYEKILEREKMIKEEEALRQASGVA